MKKTKNKKIKKVIFILVLILLIIFLLIKFIEKKPKNYQVPRGNYIENTDDKYLEERVVPRNIKVLNNYNGNVNRDNLYKKLQNLVNFIIDVNDNQKQIDEYFKENEKNIESLFGTIDLEKFKSMVEKIKLNGVKDFKYAEIIEKSNNIFDNAFSFEVSLNFENEEKVNLKVYIRNESTSIEKDIIFEIIK